MLKRVFKKALYIYGAFLLVFITIIAILEATLPPAYVIENYTPPNATEILDRNGKRLYTYFLEIRETASQKEIPSMVKNAFIAVEDKRFYRHCGIDLVRVFKAIFVDIITLKPHQGGSTITQQLARNVFLSFKRSIIRKAREMLLALKIERYFSKDEILTLYLNQIYFGEGIYGIKTAARYFFDKDLKDLTLREAATLAAIVRSPVFYSPIKYPERNAKRANLILKIMYEEGVITKEEYEEALSEKISVHKPENIHQKNFGGYILEMIRDYIISRYGEDFLFKGGGKVYTTIDFNLQKTAEFVVDSMLTEIEKQRKIKPTREQFLQDTSKNKKPDYLQAALLALDPETGAILALVGGRNFKESPFNRVIQAKRQPGSAFKPFVYLTAIDNGFYPTDKVMDIPIVLKGQGPNGEDWKPDNYDHKYLGEITLRDALALSRNLATINLILKVGPDAVVMYAKRMGIRTYLPPYPSIALGGIELSPIELISAYAPFENGGYRIRPFFIRKIEDRNGIVLEKTEPLKVKVLDETSSYIMNYMLQTVVNHGTGINIRRKFKFELPCAGKTGTTNEYRDNWFIGFTPNLLTGVWVGFDSLRTIYKGATGAATALPIWAIFNKIVYDSAYMPPPGDFTVPENIVIADVCLQSGLLATDFCPQTDEVPYREGDEPVSYCNIHGPAGYNENSFIKLELDFIRNH